jgi:predicted site-specific integrase-resolvase
MPKDETQKNFISTREAIQLTGLHAHTIRKYADQQQIQCYKTPSGQRKYNRSCLEKFCNPILVATAVPQNEKLNYVYSRVSSKKQLDDLSRQTQYLQQARPEYASYLSVTDVASGINFKRKGLQAILDSCLQGTLGEVVIAHRDRLCRFGFELLEYIIQKNGGKITVLDHDSHKSSEQELAEDLLSIVHIYSSKQMDKRSYSRRTTQSPTNQSETLAESEENSE